MANLTRVLVLNAGSSSLKFKVFNLNHGASALAAGVGGVVERIGDVARSTLTVKTPVNTADEIKKEFQIPTKDHVSAMQTILDYLNKNVSKSFSSEVSAVGHRVVHGLDASQPSLITPEVKDTISKAVALAPLHNPAGLQGITAAQEVFVGVPQVAVFDTAFHQTMPPRSFMYALPYEMYSKHAIRRYGFHGTSHKYLLQKAAEMLGKPADQVNAITCHLGAGSSLAAIKDGQSVDTTMGLTPLEGLVMGTRSGDLDPAIVLHLQRSLGLEAKEVDNLLNKKSGLLGICGEPDVRAVLGLAAQGNPKATLALDMLSYRVRKYIGAYYAAALEGKLDALVFSGGIGENSAAVRKMICRDLEAMGIEVDDGANAQLAGGKQGVFSKGKVQLLVIPTDEELSIAQQTWEVAKAQAKAPGQGSAAASA